ncbi:type VI secretion system-associated protein TagF [Dyella choica]|uniref:type VI secretion system-associated protein TagF n=1 Tax=Dyella choica TaxID=1927959 RepID=UPI001E42E8ED|nr:type VI secretion system-associated protein TagF [Dyella choica]
MSPTEAGFFGKLPSAGDFVQRRLPSSFVETWDQHFERAVDASRQTLAQGWQHAYRSSPVWRFLLSPGVCTASAWAGVMGPAGDRVGRSFPMVIALPLDGPAAANQVLRDGDAWFAAIEHVQVAAQADPSTSVEAFDAQLLALAGMPLVEPARAVPNGVENVGWQDAAQWRMPLPRARTDGDFLEKLWMRLSESGDGWCLWWTQGGGHVPASALVTRGLPEPSSYAGFLDAQHASEGWRTLGAFDEAPHRHQHAPHVTVAAPVVSAPSRQLLPDDLSELFADLVTPVSMSVATGGAEADPNASKSHGATTTYRGDIALALVAADEGEPDVRRQAAATANQVANELRADDLAGDLKILSQRLLALHPRLRERGEDLINPVPEDGSVIAVHITRRWANLLRIGTAAAWHWRKGTLQSLFATAAEPGEDNALGGDFDDLLFTRAAPVASGLGGPTEPLCDEVVCAVEEGDRLLLVVTQNLVQFAPDVYARALAMPSCGEARARIAAAAGLGDEPARWPLAVIEVTS